MSLRYIDASSIVPMLSLSERQKAWARIIQFVFTDTLLSALNDQHISNEYICFAPNNKTKALLLQRKEIVRKRGGKWRRKIPSESCLQLTIWQRFCSLWPDCLPQGLIARKAPMFLNTYFVLFLRAEE